MSALLTHPATHAPRNAGRAAGRAGRVSVWTAWMQVVLRTITTRRQLAQMDDRMLRDIGLSRSDALEEADRAPWDIDPLTLRRRR